MRHMTRIASITRIISADLGYVKEGRRREVQGLSGQRTERFLIKRPIGVISSVM